MAWGKADSGSADAVAKWVSQLKRNDPSLSHLHIMSFRKLTEPQLAELCAAVAECTSLQELAIHGRALTEADLATISDMLQRSKHLRSINVGNGALGPAGLAALSAGLAANTSLHTLFLEGKGLDESAAPALAQICSGTLPLQELYLSRNQLTGGSISTLADAWSGQPLATLTTLDLSRNHLKADAIPHLAAMIPGLPSLSWLNLSNNALGGAVESLWPAIGQSRVEKLDLSRCAIAAEGCRGMAQGLATSQLNTLMLEECALDYEAMGLILDAVKAASTLEILGLANNSLGDEAATLIATTAPAHLKNVDLGQCGLGSDSVLPLLASPHLTRLRLFGNANVGPALSKHVEGGAALHDAATTATCLHDLDVGGCCLTHATTSALLHFLRSDQTRLPALVSLGLGGNEVDDRTALNDEVTATHEARDGLKIFWQASSAEPSS